MPSEQVATTLGISGVALTKRCARLGIPKPPRGYWARFKGNSNRSIPPMAAYQEILSARLSQKSIQPGLHLSERKQELFQKAADTVLAQNPELGRLEFKGSRLMHIDLALASAVLTTAIKHFEEFLPNTPFVSARQVAAGLLDALLPVVAKNVLVFPKSEKPSYRSESDFLVVRISENLLRHLANANRLVSDLQLAFSAIPLNSSEYCQSVRYIFTPKSYWIAKADLCVSKTHAWLRIEQQSPANTYETIQVPIDHLGPLSFVPGLPRYTHTDPEVRIYREDWDLLQTLLEAEDMHTLGSSIVYDLLDEDLHLKLGRAMKIWWPREQFQALQVLQEGLVSAEQRIEQWESELAAAKQRLCEKILGIRSGDVLQVMQQGKPGRIQVDRLDVFKYEHKITFMAHGKLFRKDGMVGKRNETLYLSLPTIIAHQLTGFKEPPQPSPQQSARAYPFWKWSWQR
ncbi:hypothetical protein [Marinobacter sp. ATCH36]|uniref:hypothetical protein n=1 Tax=Marinobacter sp. ATCH36 TaxID=2945106 RepID=UPI002021F3E8|nr:hypothetical protein [Marinobacter sp. ATCH36]MCL7944762.1 hypothetical protein [Marinobacter sp. ATCH36]